MNQTRIVLGLGCLLAIAITANGNELLRREGQYIRLTTDLSSAQEADVLVATFDAAVPQWIDFWKLPADALDDWKVNAFVMRNRDAFEREGLISDRVPEFSFGYALGDTVWVIAQPSEYYTRQLLLHEGVHSLAFRHFGGGGPTWFMEGTAELLSTHLGQESSVKINQIPANRDAVPYWGRFKLINELRANGQVPPIETVMGYAPSLQGEVESYAWSWAAAMLFYNYPESRNAFLAAAQNGRDRGPGFNRKFYQRLAGQWPVVAARWRVMCHDLDYGFDWQQQRLEISVSDSLWNGRPIERRVDPSRGWQSIGVRIAAGTTLTLTATGQVTLADQPKPWTSEPPGVTIEYHDGRPLGQLLVCLLPNATPRRGHLPPLEVHAVRAETTIKVAQHSWLLLRVNDAVGGLRNNTGGYQVVLATDH